VSRKLGQQSRNANFLLVSNRGHFASSSTLGAHGLVAEHVTTIYFVADAGLAHEDRTSSRSLSGLWPISFVECWQTRPVPCCARYVSWAV
jgi:hypothetical protein